MKSILTKAAARVRTPRECADNIHSKIIRRKLPTGAFDAVAYAAALEVLG